MPFVPVVGVNGTSLPWSAGVNSPVTASVQATPSTDVSIWNLPVEALPASPQAAVGSTANWVMLIRRPRSTVRNFGTNWLVGVPLLSPAVLPQPVPCDVSRACPGPQPIWVRSGPLNPASFAPPLRAAQSRRIAKSRVVVDSPTWTDVRIGSYPAP